jgi:hypothetical protein
MHDRSWLKQCAKSPAGSDGAAAKSILFASTITTVEAGMAETGAKMGGSEDV